MDLRMHSHFDVTNALGGSRSSRIRRFAGHAAAISMALVLAAGSPPPASADVPARLDSGGDHTCALVVSGLLKCWGSNDYGQLAAATLVTDPKTKKPLSYNLANGSSNAVEVKNLAGIPSLLATGGQHSCAVLLNGITRCWGLNEFGQLGKDATVLWSGKTLAIPCKNADAETDVKCGVVPLPVQNLGGTPTQLAPGGGHTCALMPEGAVKCWGGDDRYSTAPITIGGLTSQATAVASGLGHSCALLTGGSVSCWGWNGDGQIGRDGGLDSVTAISVQGLSGSATAVTAGDYHSCALIADGSVQCWGLNDFGQLGNGSTDGSAIPVTVQGLPGKALSIDAGGRHTCAVIEGGGVSCWGANKLGQLGSVTGTGCNGFKCSTSATAVAGLSGKAAAVAAGGSHTCSMTDDGRVHCWGGNAAGALGSPTTTTCLDRDGLIETPCSLTPVTIAGLNLTRPAPGLTARPAALTNLRAAVFGFSQLQGATFTCSIDSGPAVSCPARFTTPSQADGRHTLEVTAVKDGVTSEPTTASWTVDATPPVLRSRSRTRTRTQTIFRFVVDPDPSGIARVEYSLAPRAPAANARNVPANTAAYRSPLTFRQSAQIKWIRLQDKAGNWSRWYAG